MNERSLIFLSIKAHEWCFDYLEGLGLKESHWYLLGMSGQLPVKAYSNEVFAFTCLEILSSVILFGHFVVGRVRQKRLFWWRSRLPRYAKRWPQRAQAKGRRPSCVRTWSLTLQSFVNFLPHVKHSRTWFLRPVSAFKFYTFRKPLDLSKACFLIKPGFFFFLASLDYNLGAVFNISWTSSIWASSSMSSSKKSGELQLPSQLCSSETCS